MYLRLPKSRKINSEPSITPSSNNHIPDILDNVDINVFNENMKLNIKALEKKHLAKTIHNYFLNYY